MKAYRKHYASLPALQRYIDATPRLWSYRESVNASPSARWDLHTNYEGALKLARDGWQEGARRLASGLASLPAIQTMPETAYAMAGYLPEVGRYCAGMPDNMITWNEDQGAKPVITLGVAISANCGTDANAMSNYGLAIARYTDELEARGYRVEISAAMVCHIDGTRVVHSWTVKEAGDAMNLADVAFSIGHPAAFRRLCFALIERTPVRECGSYGYPKDLEPGDLPNPAIILNGMRSVNDHSRTYEGALAHVGKIIEAAMEQTGE